MRTVLAIIFCAVALASCKNRKEALRDSAAMQADTLRVVVFEKAAPQADSLIIAFEKTPCFGRCPVYKFKVYQSGFALYEGINFTERLGLFSTTISKDKIGRIYELAHKTDFFELDSLYDNPYVSDLPSTIVMLSHQGEKKRVLSRMNPPEKLLIFMENAAVILNENNWVPYDLR